MTQPKIKNWKLNEVIEEVSIINFGVNKYIDNKLSELNIPSQWNDNFSRKESFINWSSILSHSKFFFDLEGDEGRITLLFQESTLKNAERLIFTYLQEDVIVKVPTQLFLNDWEGFLRSMHFNGLIFTEDFSFVMEVTRDYYLHSNFVIDGNNSI